MIIKPSITGLKRRLRLGVLLAATTTLLLPVTATTVARAADPPTGQISGRVTDAHNTPLENIRVDAYASAADYGNGINNGGASVAVTQADGTYTLEGLPVGNYLVVFNQGGGGNNAAYATDFYPNEPSIGLAQPVTVTADVTTPNIDAHLTAPGSITGKITNVLGKGLANITVNVYASVDDYNNGILSGGYHAGSDGVYQINGLHEGAYFVVFNQDLNAMYQSSYETEFYHARAMIGSADPVIVNAGETTPHIDATLTAFAPMNKDQCKHGGWKQFTRPHFKNQGQCVCYVEHHN